MEILTKQYIDTVGLGNIFQGVACIRDYSKKQTKYGKDFLDGKVQFGITMPFKVWFDASALMKMTTEDYTNVPCLITATVEEFQGSKSLTITDVKAVDGYTEDMFFEVRYNKQAYIDAFNNEANRVLSDKGKKVKDLLLTDEVAERFYSEFAASKYHDNCTSGLMVHTYKMMCIVGWIVRTYPQLVMDYDEVNGKYIQSQDRVDLLYIGLMFHDLGKTVEMHNGVYQRNSFVGHTFFGTEMLVKHKDEIVSIFDEDWYYQLCAILLQHHDEYETPCKTVLGYVIHSIDLIESRMTGLCQQLDSSTFVDSTGAKIKYDNKILIV